MLFKFSTVSRLVVLVVMSMASAETFELWYKKVGSPLNYCQTIEQGKNKEENILTFKTSFLLLYTTLSSTHFVFIL